MSGIVRRIDELGRIVIPKEIRRTLRIRDGEQLEIAEGGNGNILISKFSGLKTLQQSVDSAVNAINRETGKEVYAFDSEKIIGHSDRRNSLVGANVANKVMNIAENRQGEICENFNITAARKIETGYVMPIVVRGDLYGGIVVGGELKEADIMVVNAVATCLGGMLEI